MDMTLDVMAHSLVYWTQDLWPKAFWGNGSRIFSMTSAGGRGFGNPMGRSRQPNQLLESHTRQLALELAPLGYGEFIDGRHRYPALRKIPGSSETIGVGSTRILPIRLTTTQDVAEALGLLSHPKTHWITGNVICVDGESLSLINRFSRNADRGERLR